MPDPILLDMRPGFPSDLPPSQATRHHALLNGKHVCPQAFMADERRGMVGLMQTRFGSWPGAFYIDPATNEPAEAFYYGHVQIIPMRDGEEPCNA